MPDWKMPPKAKVYEALSAVADDRVHTVSPSLTEVVSSERDKTYKVSWSEEGQAVSSDDNASRWQGYIGYPIIAALMLAGKIAYRRDVADRLKGVAWKQLNDSYKRDYEAAIEHVLETIVREPAARKEIEAEVDSIFERLKELELRRLPQPARQANP
jgi:hypothetical protein